MQIIEKNNILPICLRFLIFDDTTLNILGLEELPKQVDANTDPPSMKEELVKELLQEFDTLQIDGPDDTHLRVLRGLTEFSFGPHYTMKMSTGWRGTQR